MPPMLTTQTSDMAYTRLLLFPILLLLLLTACQPVQGPLSRTQPIEIKTVPAETEGLYQQAAEEYMQLASEYEGARRTLYYLRAAELFWKSGQVAQASNALEQVNPDLLNEDKRFNAASLGAEIALYDSRGEASLAALEGIDANTLSAENKRKLLKLRADAYTLTGNWLEKAKSHLQLEPLLNDEAAIAQNRESLWQALMQMTPQALDMYNPGYPPADDSGWFALAYAVKAYQHNPEAQEVALEDWRRSYPRHPADPALYQEALKTAGSLLPQHIRDIAVILPADGPFVEAARSIKQGIIAAHYASGSASKLHFLNVQTSPSPGQAHIEQLYQKAISLGADIIIGPLQKASVETLARLPELPVPVLALNRVDAELSRPNLYQFALAPEDDATAVATFARRRGYQHAVVLAPQGDWGDRVAEAFSQAWLEQGGNILSQAQYNEAENDFRDVLIPLMGLDVSEQRYRALKSVLGRSLSFEPRRRQDIDFLFLIARPLKARQLVPQLKFHRSGQLPIIATSHAYTGQKDPQQDIDLNDLIIADIPWMFPALASQDEVYQMLQEQSQDQPGGLLRLYALGVDAYRLVPQLNQLSLDPEQIYQGATGNLSLSETGQIVRNMSWGQFKQGNLEPLE